MSDLEEAVGLGLASVQFTDLVTYLAEELRQLEGLEEGVGRLKSSEDVQVW